MSIKNLLNLANILSSDKRNVKYRKMMTEKHENQHNGILYKFSTVYICDVQKRFKSIQFTLHDYLQRNVSFADSNKKF